MASRAQISQTETTNKCLPISLVKAPLAHAAPIPACKSELANERNQSVIDHLPMIRAIARRIHRGLPLHVEVEDLVSAGVLGLMDAWARFDERKQVQFRSYAQFRVRGAILDSLRGLDWGPRELRRKSRVAQEVIRTLTQQMGTAPCEAQIAEELGVPLSEYQQLLGDLHRVEVGSLQVEHSDGSEAEEVAYLSGIPEEDPLFRCLAGELRKHLVDAIDELPEKERLVLTLYYYEELTLKEIGLTLGVVESRVSQIRSSAVLRLRSALGVLETVSGGAAQRAVAS